MKTPIPYSHATELDASNNARARRPLAGAAQCHAPSAVSAGKRPFPIRPQLALGFKAKVADMIRAISQPIAGRVTGLRRGSRLRSANKTARLSAPHATAATDMGAMVQGRAAISS